MSPEHSRTDGSLLCHGSVVSVLTQTSVVSPVQELQVEVGSHWKDHSLGRSGRCGSSPVLIGSRSSSRGRPSGLPVVWSDTDNRRLQLRLGCSPRQHPLLGKVDSTGVKEPRKRSRDNGSSQSDPSLSGEPPGRSPSRPDGQYHSPVLSELEGGGDQVPVSQPISSGDPSLVSGQVDHDSSGSPVRSRQRRSRHSISSFFESPNQAGQLGGVVSRSGPSQPTVSGGGSPIVDLFATAANAKVPAFYSRTAEPSACRGDSFRADWSRGLLYMYPPIPLLHLALHKIRREEADVIAILPWWPRRGWFPLVLSLLVDLPVVLPVRPDVISNPQGLPHPGLSTLRLAAWRLSRKHSKQREFQQQLHAPSALVKDSLREICTTPNGGIFAAGALNTASIPFTQLCSR